MAKSENCIIVGKWLPIDAWVLWYLFLQSNNFSENLEPLFELLNFGWLTRKILVWLFHPRTTVHYAEIEMIDEQSFHITKTDSKGSTIMEFDIKNDLKSQFQIRNGFWSFLNCEVNSCNIWLATQCVTYDMYVILYFLYFSQKENGRVQKWI